MELRPLGHTGVSVSQFCLGAMMFGAWGNTDYDESIRIIHRALEAGINFVHTPHLYGAGDRNRRDALGAPRSRPPGKGPLHRLPDLPRQPDRRGTVDGPRPAPAAVRHRATTLLDSRTRRRGRRPSH